MDVTTVINHTKQLPPTPEILPRLKETLKDGNASVNDIISLIKLDQSLAAQIVRVSNSAFYGASMPSENLEEAVNRIGFNEVYKLVAFVASSHVLSGENKLYGYASNELWMRSVCCAIVMQHIAQTIGEDSDTAYTIGLMHAIGKVAINAYFEANKLSLPKQRFRSGDITAERQELGFDHTEVGAELLQRWKFNPEVILPIQQQYALEAAPSQHKRLTCLLQLAKLAVPVLDLKPRDIAQGFDYDDQIIHEVGLDEDELICCIMAAKAAMHDIHDLIDSQAL